MNAHENQEMFVWISWDRMRDYILVENPQNKAHDWLRMMISCWL